MRSWKPQPSGSHWIGLAILIAVAGGTAALALRLERQLAGPPESWAVDLSLYGQAVLLLILIILVVMLGYHVLAALTLSYNLDRNGLYITWLGSRAIVALDQIQHVDIGAPVSHIPLRFGQITGYSWGETRIDDERVLYFFTTQPLTRCLTIHTPRAVYALSPANPEGFVQDLEQRRNLGATKPLATVIGSGHSGLSVFWNDRVVRSLLLVALAINLLVLGLIAARYPALSPMLEMRFSAAGDVAALQPRHQLLFLPFAALSLSVLNIVLGVLLYRQQLLGARLLQGASVLVQVLFGIAIATLIH